MTQRLTPKHCEILGELADIYYILQGDSRPDDRSPEFEAILDRCDILWDQYNDQDSVEGFYPAEDQDGNLVASSIAMCQYPRVYTKEPRGEDHWIKVLAQPDLGPRARLRALHSLWLEPTASWSPAEMAYARALVWDEIGCDKVAAILVRFALSFGQDAHFTDLALKLGVI